MDLDLDLRRLGVVPGDLLMLHVSLRAAGLARSQGAVRGAERLLAAIDDALGPEGTSMMILGSDYALDSVNLRPVEERAALLAGTEPFRIEDASVLPEVGWFAEVFRTTPGTRLSSNPSGRFAARGARAEELLADQPWDDYYGPGSPLEKLCRAGGRVLRIGADDTTSTVLHYAEYLADVPDKRRTRWDYLLAKGEGSEHVFVTCLNDSDGIVDWDGDDYFALIQQAYRAGGRPLATGTIGAAPSELIDAADLVAFGARWMETSFAAARR